MFTTTTTLKPTAGPKNATITMVIHNFFFHKITCYNFKILVKSCEIIHGNEIGQMWAFIS